MARKKSAYVNPFVQIGKHWEVWYNFWSVDRNVGKLMEGGVLKQ